ncbi:NADH-quinone oxidoreductase subunit N [Rubritalea spongiae]|uniref:NADH-quinone oxidoreductase subunit N n=1 Tax=Rubritalea spongiae TaxID=430797 RepID=A0ABW5E6F2_9BACT
MFAYLEFFIAGFGLILLMWEAFASPKKKSTLALIGAAGLSIAFLALIVGACCSCSYDIPSWMSRFYSNDGHALFFKGFALVSTIAVLLMSYDFEKVLNKFTSPDASDSNAGEFYCLPIFACTGLMWMASATDLVSIFVALELVTISFYVMVAFMRRNVGSLEAGVKYLILGALSTGFLVYGIAWIYGALGTTDITRFTDIQSSTALLFGLALVIIALAFKVGAAPMQLWIPDVYQGAPTPITAYLSVASKAAGFGVAITILRPFLEAEVTRSSVATVLVILAAATLLYGNLAALAQTNFKRLLAYSSIAHAGFILIGISTSAFDYVLFYLATYLIMTFAAFFILSIVRNSEDSDEISALDGLGKRNPLLAVALTIIMAAMAGVPLTAGFVGKFFMFETAVSNIATVHWVTVVIAFIGAACGFYYYFKIIRAIYWNDATNAETIRIPLISKCAIALLTIALIIFGIYPAPIFCWIS